MLGLLNVGSIDEFKSALNQLFAGDLFRRRDRRALFRSSPSPTACWSCKVNGTDTASIIREGQCLWAGASARFLNTGTTSDQIGFDETAGLFTAGAQVAGARRRVAARRPLPVTSRARVQTATGAQSEGSLAQGGRVCSSTIPARCCSPAR